MANSKTAQQPFLTDVKTLRERARRSILEGAVTSSYTGDVDTAIRILNEALATEIVCTLRYKNHYYMATGLHSGGIKDEFLVHAKEEEQHADWLAERIQQLGGTPNMNPEGMLTRSHAEYQEGETLIAMLQEDLIAERIAIESYTEMVRYFGVNDPTSRRLLEKILAKEEEHANELADFLKALHPPKSQKESAA